MSDQKYDPVRHGPECQHGQLLGHCRWCDCVEKDAEIARLTAEVARVTGELQHSRTCDHCLKDGARFYCAAECKDADAAFAHDMATRALTAESRVAQLEAVAGWALPEACAMLCPSVGKAGVPIPHLPECLGARAALVAAAAASVPGKTSCTCGRDYVNDDEHAPTCASVKGASS